MTYKPGPPPKAVWAYEPKDKIIQNTQGRTFVDDHIDLSGAQWINCVFDGCIVELNGLHALTGIHGCLFQDCQYRGSGWPDWVPKHG